MRKRVICLELPDATPEELREIEEGLARLAKEDNLPYTFIVTNKPCKSLTTKEMKSLLEEVVKQLGKR